MNQTDLQFKASLIKDKPLLGLNRLMMMIPRYLLLSVLMVIGEPVIKRARMIEYILNLQIKNSAQAVNI